MSKYRITQGGRYLSASPNSWTWTHVKEDAILFSVAEDAIRLADQWSVYWAVKGYGYRARVQEA